MAEPEEFMTLATFDSLTSAELARGILDEEGIHAFLVDAETVNMDWMLSNAVGGIKLKVAREDFMKAERVLNSRRQKSRRSGLDDYGLPEPTKAITKDPRVREEVGQADEDFGDPSDIDDEEIEDEEENKAEGYVRGAFRCAVFGLIICPPLLHVYSLYMLAEAARLRRESGARFPRLFWVTLLLDAAVVLTVVALFTAMLAGSINSGR